MRHRVRRVHFVGIGGAGMSGLAEILHASGYRVSGSDRADGSSTRRLAARGIEVGIGHDAAAVEGADFRGQFLDRFGQGVDLVLLS